MALAIKLDTSGRVDRALIEYRPPPNIRKRRHRYMRVSEQLQRSLHSSQRPSKGKKFHRNRRETLQRDS
eukprot:scaffold12097_cov25-Prasinocladus_malaysianus.AAC.1